MVGQLEMGEPQGRDRKRNLTHWFIVRVNMKKKSIGYMVGMKIQDLKEGAEC